MSRPTAEQRRHWDEVVKLGCLVTRSNREVTIHHAHGGSLKERGFHRTFGRKASHWLVLPLNAGLHTGPWGIDGFPRPTVEQWEAWHRRQDEMLDEICERLGRDVWALARAEEKGMVPRWGMPDMEGQ